jgi:hypothetical protein
MNKIKVSEPQLFKIKVVGNRKCEICNRNFKVNKGIRHHYCVWNWPKNSFHLDVCSKKCIEMATFQLL